MAPKLFVAGATGYTGRALVTHARQRGAAVVAHVRPGSPSGDALVAGLEAEGAIVDRSPWTAEAIAAAFAAHDPTHVFALLGTTRARTRAAEQRGATETYESIDRDLSLMLLAAAGTRRFIYLSSLGAERPGGNRYLRARHEVEKALASAAARWTIARPSFITGPDRGERRPGERVAAVLADAALGLLGLVGAKTLRDRYRSMDAQTLAAALYAAALDEGTVGAVLDAAALRALTS